MVLMNQASPLRKALLLCINNVGTCIHGHALAQMQSRFCGIFFMEN